MITTKNTIDEEWKKFMSQNLEEQSDDEDINENSTEYNGDFISANICMDLNSNAPKSSDIYISTKTKIAYLNTQINLKEIFWQIPVIPYAKPCEGIIKKQMKFNSTEKEELTYIQEKLKDIYHYEEHIITHIDNPTGRIKYKDIRKISIGISKKDIMSYRCKKKSAFYNCFVLIMRIRIDNNTFKEFHVKVFNTGKIEIPGVQSETNFQKILSQILETLQPFIKSNLNYIENTVETVLINSNFNCGFFINREALYDILKMKYNLQSIYDPCSYPGIQSKFYYNPDVPIQNGCQISEEHKHLYKNIREVSFMIFRTGSVLIVGKCDENTLFEIYEYLKIIFSNEYNNICQKSITNENLVFTPQIKDKKKKIRKKNITVDVM
jgi:TATA-box binding protein (TBP) (component of TFIID and TFIIIB)